MNAACIAVEIEIRTRDAMRVLVENVPESKRVDNRLVCIVLDSGALIY